MTARIAACEASAPDFVKVFPPFISVHHPGPHAQVYEGYNAHHQAPMDSGVLHEQRDGKPRCQGPKDEAAEVLFCLVHLPGSLFAPAVRQWGVDGQAHASQGQ